MLVGVTLLVLLTRILLFPLSYLRFVRSFYLLQSGAEFLEFAEVGDPLMDIYGGVELMQGSFNDVLQEDVGDMGEETALVDTYCCFKRFS